MAHICFFCSQECSCRPGEIDDQNCTGCLFCEQEWEEEFELDPTDDEYKQLSIV